MIITNNIENKHRPLIKLCTLLFFICMSILIIGTLMPFSGPNAWRDSQTFSVAKNFFTETWNLFTPHYDLRGTGNGSLPGEFPLYSYFVGFFLNIFGNYLFIGRIINVISSLIIVRLISKHLQVNFYITATTFFSNTLLFSQSFSIMPEIFSLLFAILAIYALNLNFIFSVCFLTLSTLIKPSGLMVFPYIFLMSKNKLSLRNVALFLIPILFLFIWKNFTLKHNYTIYSDYPHLFEHYSRNLEIILSEITYTNIFHAIKKFFVHGLSILGVISVFFIRRENFQKIIPILGWLSACLFFLLISGSVQKEQNYYATPTALASLFLILHLMPKKFLLFLIPLQLLISICFYQYKYFFSEASKWSNYRQDVKINEFSTREHLFAVNGTRGDSTILGRIDRRGISQNIDKDFLDKNTNYDFIYSEVPIEKFPKPSYILKNGYVWDVRKSN